LIKIILIRFGAEKSKKIKANRPEQSTVQTAVSIASELEVGRIFAARDRAPTQSLEDNNCGRPQEKGATFWILLRL